MYAVLVLGAVFVAFPIAMFAGGALVALASLCMQALRAIGRTQNAKAEATLSKPVVRPAGLPEAVKAETFVAAGAECAPA